MTRETMLRPLAEPLHLHPPEDASRSSTAQLDTMSCAAPVQEALQAGTTCEQHCVKIYCARSSFHLLIFCFADALLCTHSKQTIAGYSLVRSL